MACLPQLIRSSYLWPGLVPSRHRTGSLGLRDPPGGSIDVKTRLCRHSEPVIRHIALVSRHHSPPGRDVSMPPTASCRLGFVSSLRSSGYAKVLSQSPAGRRQEAMLQMISAGNLEHASNSMRPMSDGPQRPLISVWALSQVWLTC